MKEREQKEKKLKVDFTINFHNDKKPIHVNQPSKT